MKQCPSCGNQAADNAVFCDQCGTRLPEAAPVFEATPVESPEFEAEVAAPSGGIPEGIVLCPACGAENVPGEVFCDLCGEPLETPEPLEAIAVVEEPLIEEAIIEVEELPVDESVAVEEVMPEAVVEEMPAGDEVFCQVCGSSINAGDTFCGSCGAAVGGPVEQMVVDEEPLFEEPPFEEFVEEPLVDEQVEEIVEEVVIEEPLFETFDDEPVIDEPLEELVIEAPIIDAQIQEAVIEEEVFEEVVAGPPVCPVCGAEITPGQRFCGDCGADIAGPEEVELEVEPEVLAVVSGPYLEVVTSGAQIPLVLQPELLVGRLDEVSGIEPEVDMTPHGGLDGGVSRRHAQLFYEKGNWFVFDLDSTNGTCVNGQEIAPKTRVPVFDGAKIEFGEIEVILHTG